MSKRKRADSTDASQTSLTKFFATKKLKLDSGASAPAPTQKIDVKKEVQSYDDAPTESAKTPVKSPRNIADLAYKGASKTPPRPTPSSPTTSSKKQPAKKKEPILSADEDEEEEKPKKKKTPPSKKAKKGSKSKSKKNSSDDDDDDAFELDAEAGDDDDDGGEGEPEETEEVKPKSKSSQKSVSPKSLKDSGMSVYFVLLFTLYKASQNDLKTLHMMNHVMKNSRRYLVLFLRGNQTNPKTTNNPDHKRRTRHST